MTTSVNIAMPAQNHKRVRVDYIDIAADGSETVAFSTELDHGGETGPVYVYDTRAIRITEID